MDNLTHLLTGLALSRAGLNRVVPRATWILLLAVNAPDVDAISGFWGAVPYLHYHRQLTHALVALPIVALLPVLLARLFTSLNWKRTYAISFVGVASHLALDASNTYGIRLLFPFSSRWFRLDITNIVDVWIWAVLLLAAVGPLLARMVSAEIGAPQKHTGRGLSLFALSFLTIYEFGRFVLHQRAVAILDARIYEGVSPVRVAALPSPFSPFRWRGLVETGAFYSIHQVDVLDEFDPAGGRVFYKPEPSPAMESAKRSGAFQVFLQFSQYPLWRVTPVSEPGNGLRVEAMDLRFGDPPLPAFVATAVIDNRLQVLESKFSFVRVIPR